MSLENEGVTKERVHCTFTEKTGLVLRGPKFNLTVLRLERRVEIGIRLQLPKPNAVFKGKYVSSLIIYGRYTTTIFQRETMNNVAKVV